MQGIFLLMLVIITFLMALYISGFLMNRAIFKVIEIFYRQDALERNHAKTLEELELQPPSFLERITRFRDYKPYALRFLVEREIIQMTPDRKMYLVEKQLDENLRRKMHDQVLSNGRG
jgi:hypothetical protein